MAMRTDRIGGLFKAGLRNAAFAAAFFAAGAAFADGDLADAVKADLKNVVRQGGIGDRPFWNANASMFMYPPAFDFREVGNVKRYSFRVLASDGKLHTFVAKSPKASLAPVWDKLPTGWTAVECYYNVHQVVGSRLFWKSAPYTPGKYPPAAMPYAEAVKRGYEYVFNHPLSQHVLKTGEPDFTVYHSCYPSKMYSAIIKSMVSYADYAPEKAEEAIAIAKASADWLISVSEPKGAPLEFWPPTYWGENAAAKSNKGRVMLIYPAQAAVAYAALYRKTKVEKYLDAAEKIAAHFLRLQGEDGTWPLIMTFADGQVHGKNRLVPIQGAIPMFAALHGITGKADYKAALDRAFEYMDKGPMATWNWEGQFEDVRPSSPYSNLTKHNACDMALYILERFPKNRKRIAEAREILRFAEDQFVCWELPFDGAAKETFFGDGDWKEGVGREKWGLPGVLEQYGWYVPIDASASKLIKLYLALYRAEGKPLDLAKARTLGDSITRNLHTEDNHISTHWYGFEPVAHQWLNCHIASVAALDELDAVVQATK
ncbi:MAG: hypothetical protein J5807_03730 [Kiritimatiellae bacterium]|nr:hypothetical protein [Kiritimatiellia bacterium]